MANEHGNTDDPPSVDDVAKLLWAHADSTAERVIETLGGPLTAGNLSTFLQSPACLRYETVLLFDDGPLDPHQFAQPVLDEAGEARRCRLYVHPRYALHPEAVPYLVAYMAAAINYGDAADADLCEHLGAMLVQEKRDAFYEKVCEFADLG